MTDLQRSGSVLVAEIKANHGAESNGSAIAGQESGAHGSSSLVDPSIATPFPAATGTEANGLTGHDESALNAGTGATVIPHATEAEHGAVADPMPDTTLVNHAAAPDAETVAPAALVSEGTTHQPQTAPVEGMEPTTYATAGHPDQLATSDPYAADHTGLAPQSAAMEPTHSALNGASQIGSEGHVATDPAVANHEEHAAFAPGAAAVAAPLGVGAGAAALASHHNEAPTAAAVQEPAPQRAPAVAAGPALSEKEIKKMDKLMKKEAKNEHKSLKRAIKDAGASEKLMRKSRDADVQALKRHEKATTNEHKAAKALNKAKLEHEKCVAELNKAVEDLDIKRKHTASTKEGYEKAKAQIDHLRTQKQANDRARIDRSAQIHGVHT